MSTLDNIIGKISVVTKTELKQHHIELALADDVKKAYNDAIAARKKSLDEYQKLKPLIASALKMQNDLKALNDNALTVFAKFEQAAKDLGIQMPKDVIDQKTNIQDGLKGSIAAQIKALQSIKL